MKKDRIPEVHFYEWRISAWAISETRDRLDAAGRRIYRELLDACYGQGRFPDDESWMIRRCACTPEEFARTWPLIQKHFPISKTAGYRENIPANIIRREYFGYITGQRKRRKDAINKANKKRELDELASTGDNSGYSADQPNGKLTATAIQANGEEKLTATASEGAVVVVMPRASDFPLTDAAIRGCFATADLRIVTKVIEKALQAYLSVDAPKIPAPVDADFAEAVSVAWAESRNQTSAALFLSTVPAVITNWSMHGRHPPKVRPGSEARGADAAARIAANLRAMHPEAEF
jgi:hypothetical protein